MVSITGLISGVLAAWLVPDQVTDRFALTHAIQIFELIVGQPPLQSLMATPRDIVRQMIVHLGEPPAHWKDKWESLQDEFKSLFFILRMGLRGAEADLKVHRLQKLV